MVKQKKSVQKKANIVHKSKKAPPPKINKKMAQPKKQGKQKKHEPEVEEEEDEILEEAQMDTIDQEMTSDSDEIESEEEAPPKPIKAAPQKLPSPLPEDSDESDTEDIEASDDDSGEDDEEQEDDDDEAESDSPVVGKPVKIPNTKKTDVSHGKSFHADDSEQPPSTRVFISNLAKASSTDSITRFFENNKLNLTDLYIPKSENMHKGFAFAEFESMSAATKAVELNGKQLDGADISICFAKPRKAAQTGYENRDSNETNILFVKNLGPNVTKEVLESHFKNADDVRLMTNPDGSCRGHAYIEYPSSVAAKSAKENMAGLDVNGAVVHIDFAQPRGSFNSRGSRGRGGFQGGRGGFDKGRRDSGGFQRGGHRGGDSRGGNRYFSGGRGNFQRGGGAFPKRGGFNGKPRGNKIQFNDDD